MTFELVIDDVPFRLEAKQRTENLHDIKKIHVNWDVWRVFIPPQIKRDKKEIYQIIESALQRFGFTPATSPDRIAGLNVNFLPNL